MGAKQQPTLATSDGRRIQVCAGPTIVVSVASNRRGTEVSKDVSIIRRSAKKAYEPRRSGCTSGSAVLCQL